MQNCRAGLRFFQMKAVSFGKGGKDWKNVYAIIGLNSIENNNCLLEKLFGPYE